MCGRYGFIPGTKIFSRFGVQKRVKLPTRYNVTPGSIMPVIVRRSPNQIVMMKWGLVPHWAKDPEIGYKMINARAETLKEKPAFRSLISSKRCLIPASGFYEWEHLDKIKQPYYIKLLNEEMFSFAGLYDVWKNEKGQAIETYTIITTDPNCLIARIHDRMPVILDREGEEQWLGTIGQGPDKLLTLLKQYPADEMEAYQVSKLVNSPKNDSEELIERLK